MLGLQECRTAADVRALAKRTIQKSQKLRHPPPPRVIAINDLTPGPIVIQITRPVGYQTRTGLLAEPISYPSMRSIIDVVCVHYDKTRMDIVSDRRTKDIVMPRQIACYLAQALTPFSLPVIGKHMGGRDHTTILHACRKIARLRTEKPDLDHEIGLLETTLGGRKPIDRLTLQIKMTKGSPWTDKKVCDLFEKLLRSTTLPFREVATVINDQLGTSLTKSACLGRARRFQISRSNNPIKEAA
jgi:hypothetical protein